MYHSPMKKIIRFISGICIAVLAVSLLLFPAAQAAAKSTNTTPKLTLGKVYKSAELGFSRKIGKGWTAHSDEQGLQISFLNEGVETELGGHGANVTVTKTLSGRPLAVELEDVRTAYPEAIPGFVFKADKPFKIKSAEAHRFDGAFSIEDNEVRNSQLFVKHSSDVFIITASTFAKDWKKDNAVFQKMFKSFKLLKK